MLKPFLYKKISNIFTPKMYTIVWLEFELASFDASGLIVSHYAKEIYPLMWTWWRNLKQPSTFEPMA